MRDRDLELNSVAGQIYPHELLIQALICSSSGVAASFVARSASSEISTTCTSPYPPPPPPLALFTPLFPVTPVEIYSASNPNLDRLGNVSEGILWRS